MTALVAENLPLLAAAPSGISKLRELVFALAAQGRLIDDGEGATARSSDLGKVAEFVMGQAPPGTACNFNGDGTVFVKTGEFGPLFPVIREWTTKPLKFARNGDVLICVVGATVGKLNLGIDCAIGRSVAAIRPKAVLDTRYLYFALMPFTLKLRAKSRGSAQGVIGKSELAQVRIRLPSLASQQRIVAKVEELMALCDRLQAEQADAEAAHAKLVETLLASLTQARDAPDLRASWQQLAEHFHTLFTTEGSIDALKQTVLQVGVMGKLVPQDLNDEPASELLKKASAERASLAKDGKFRKGKLTAPTEIAEQPFQLPAGWVWCQVNDLVSIKHGYAFSSSHFIESNGPLVLTTPGNFFETGGFRDRGDRTRYYDGPTSNEFTLRPGDLIVAMTEQAAGLLGSAAFVPDDGKVYLHNQRLGKLIFNTDQVAAKYIYYFFNGMLLRESIAASSTGMKVKHTSPEKIGRVPFPLPPLLEQHRIADKIERLFAFCDQLKLNLGEARQHHEHLASVLVEQAVH